MCWWQCIVRMLWCVLRWNNLWLVSSFFFFNDTATTEIYTLSLHDALPISTRKPALSLSRQTTAVRRTEGLSGFSFRVWLRSEEHTSELQSRPHLVCRLLLEKKKSTWKKSSCSLHTANSTPKPRLLRPQSRN